MLVQALVAQAIIEALDKAVLLRLAKSDVMPLDACVLAPREDGPNLDRRDATLVPRSRSETTMIVSTTIVALVNPSD